MQFKIIVIREFLFDFGLALARVSFWTQRENEDEGEPDTGHDDRQRMGWW